VIGAHARRVITGFGSDPVHLFAFQVDAKNMLFEHWFEGRNKQRLPFFIKSNNSVDVEITFCDLTDQLAVGFISVQMIETISVAVPEKISRRIGNENGSVLRLDVLVMPVSKQYFQLAATLRVV